MAVIKSGVSTDQMTVDATSKAARETLYDSDGVQLLNKKTYATSGSFTPPATPQDLVFITGSATKIVRVQSMKIGSANTAAGSQIFFLNKHSAAPTGGTEVAPTKTPLDSTDTAATAVVKHVTTSANTPGTLVGILNTKKVASPVVTPATFAGIVQDTDNEMLPMVGLQVKPVTLRAATEVLAINFAGTALVSGQVHTYSVLWTEE